MGSPALFRYNPKAQYEMSMIYEGISPEVFEEDYESGMINTPDYSKQLVEKDHMDKVD